MPARERFDSQMNPLMPLEIMIPIERLRADIALERPFIGGGMLLGAIQLSRVAAVVGGHHGRDARGYTDQGHWVTGVVHVCHHGR